MTFRHCVMINLTPVTMDGIRQENLTDRRLLDVVNGDIYGHGIRLAEGYFISSVTEVDEAIDRILQAPIEPLVTV